MGLSPNIPLSVNPPAQPQGPLDMAQKGLNVQMLIQAVQQQKVRQAVEQQQLQQEQVKTQQAQQDFEDNQKFRKVFKDSGGDWTKTIANAPAADVGPQFLLKAQTARTDQITKLAASDKALLDNELVKSNAMGVSAQKVIDADPSQQATVYAQERNSHLVSGAYKPTDIPEQMPPIDTLKEMAAHSKANQDMLKEAMALQEQKAKLPGEQAEATMKQYAAGAQTMAGAPNQLSWTARRNLAVKNDKGMEDLIPETFSPQAVEQVRQLGIAPKDLAVMAPDKLELQDFLKKNPGKGPADFLAWKTGTEATARSSADLALLDALNKKSQAAGRTTAPGLTPDATDSAATTFHNTGTLPPIGRGSAGQAQRTAIMNRERELFPGTVLSANSAEFGANKKSLDNVTSTLDTLSGFESAAVKNIDNFKTLASKLPDTEMPWMNTPLRLLDEKMVGAEWMPAINAARGIANREVARVTNDPKLHGVLSDSARGEVAGMNPTDATYNQMVHVTDLMKQDMANVHSSLDAQKAAIVQRMGSQSQQQPQGGTNQNKNVSSRPANATHTGVGSVDKKKHWLDKDQNDLGVAE